MKRYRANPDMRAIYGEKTIMHEDTEGPYVKFEDVIKATNELVNLMIKPTKLREEFVLEFLEKTEVS